eukprot:gene13865-15313_t
MAEANIDYSDVVQQLRTTFRQGKTLPIWYRIGQLKQFLKMMTENKDLFVEALHQDLRKPKFESTMMEYTVVIGELMKFIDNLPEWASFQKTEADLLNKLNTCGIKYEPYGVALIIGAWNYPLLLLLQPFIGCLAAGNCAILKPSELSPATANLIESLLPRYLDEDCYKVIQGARDETTALLRENKKNRLGKFVNFGQTCLAPDYILCTKETEVKLVQSLKKALREFYGENPKDSGDLARIINNRHFERLMKLLDKEKIVIGGETDEAERYIAPTVMNRVTLDDAIMKEEIFGPLLPIVNVANQSEAIKLIAEREKPLALYVFSNTKANIDTFLDKTSSGAVCVNDSIVQAAVPSIPFGGVGQSGIGAYHGKFSFECFSHRKACLIKKQNLEPLNAIRYPPYTDSNLKTACWFLVPSRKSKYLKYFFYVAVLGAVAYFCKYYDVCAQLKRFK